MNRHLKQIWFGAVWGGGETHRQGYRIPEGSKYLVVVENVLVGPRIYSARESNMPIVEELRMEVPGPDS